MTLRQTATDNIRSILRHAIQPRSEAASLVIFDKDSPLSRLITDAYGGALPRATFVDFASTDPEAILMMFDALEPGSLVVLIQSSSFRLSEFRIRIELFQRKLKVIEHVHLERMRPEQEEAYVDSLAYDPDYYRPVGHGLKSKLDQARRIDVRSPDGRLSFDGMMEPAKLNIGDYEGMENIGGTFPIGEVFTELQDLKRLNGAATIFAYGGFDFRVRLPKPFPLMVENGLVTGAPGAPEEFLEILEKIRSDEPCHVRELGLGLNRAFGKDRVVDDITAFERQCGVHLSLGAKHGVYPKAGLPARAHAKYHIDVFVDATDVRIDELSVFDGSAFHV